MESEEFNLSVLENVTTFSTPLKDCSDYEAILSLIKEEIDISQTEDEGDDQSYPNNVSRSRAKRLDSEPCDYNDKFKPPCEINNSAKTKSPGAALFSRTKRRSTDDSKNETRKHAAQRARSLGRVMPGRSLKSACKQYRSSGCYSDSSGFSDPTENKKSLKRKNLRARKKFDFDARDVYETEGEALEELLTTAQEQVTVNGSPFGRNSTVSSQGESTLLATSDPLDTGAMEEDYYVESSQPICASDFHKKLLDHRSIRHMLKNVETIKRNLHFSDAPESEEDNQNFSLALSPEPPPLLNDDVEGNSAPAASRKRKESQDNIESILNSLTSGSRHFYSERETNTTPPRPRTGKSSQDSIAQEFNSWTPNSYNSEYQRGASTTSQPSSMSKTSRESTPGIRNLTHDLHDLERQNLGTSTTPQPSTTQRSRESTPSTASTLNLILDLEELESKREASRTPECPTRKTRPGSTTSTTSTASTLNLPLNLQDLEPKREPITPQHSSEASQGSTATILKNLTQDLQNLDPDREASTTLEPSSMGEPSQNNTPSTLDNLAQSLQGSDPEREELQSSSALQTSSMCKRTQDSTAGILKNSTKDSQDLDPENPPSTTIEPSIIPNISQDSTPSIPENLGQDLQDSDPKREVNRTQQPSSMIKTTRDSTSSTLQDRAEDLQDFDSERESSATLQPSNISKMCQDSTASTSENLAQDLQNFNPEKETSATLPHPRKQKTSRNNQDPLMKNLTEQFDRNNVDSAKEADLTPLRSRERKTSQGSTANSPTKLTREMQNLVPEREADASLLHPGNLTKTSQDGIVRTSKSLTPNSCNSHNQREASPTAQPFIVRKTSQNSTANIQENVTQDLRNLDPEREATPPRSRPRKTSQDTMTNSQESQELQHLIFKKEASATPPYPRHRRTSQSSMESSQNSFFSGLSNYDCALEARQETPARPRKRKTSQASTASSSKSPTRDASNVKDSAKEASVTSLRSRHQTTQDTIANSQESLTEGLQTLDLKKEASATPPYPRYRRTSLNSMTSSQKNCTQEQSDFDSSQEARQITSPHPRKRKTSQASTASSAKSPTRDPSNLYSAKEESVTPLRPKHWTTQDPIANSQESLTEDLHNLDFKKEASATPPYPRHDETSQNSVGNSQESFTQELNSVDFAQVTRITLRRPRKRKKSQASTVSSAMNTTQDPNNVDSAKEASLTPPRPKKKRKKKSDTAISLEGLTQHPSNVDLAKEATLSPARSRKRKNNKTRIASPPNFVTQDLTDLVLKREPSVTPPSPRKRKSTVVSPLKGLTQELENCIMNVDFDRLCEEIDNDSESPSFTFETVQLLDDYNDCNPATNNKILSKILASPNSKTDEEAPRSVEHIGEDPLEFDPLYIVEAENNEIATPSTSKRKKKTGTKKAGNKRKSLVKESKRRIDKDDSLQEGRRRSSRTRKQRVTMTMSDWEEESDLSDTAAQFSKNVDSSSEDPLDYDAPDIAATPSTSKLKKKTVTKKKENKIKSHPVDESFEKNDRSINSILVDASWTLEEGRRRSARMRRTGVPTTMSEWEEDFETAKIVKKIKAVKKKKCLSSAILDKLDDIVVQLRHEVLPQHDIEQRAGTNPLTYEQQMRFLDFASLNKDLYSTEEDEIIKRNWNAFCEDHNWDPENYGVFLQFKHGDQLIMSCMEERRKFVQFLADGLPNRPLYSVYNRFKNIYSEYVDTGEWYSPVEDKMILTQMLHNPEKNPETKFIELSKVLRRTRVSIWKRYRKLKQRESWHEKSEKVMMKVEWHLSLVTEFITKLLDVTICEDLMELKDAFIPIVVWRKLEEKIEIDQNFMKRSWEQQFHLQFFSPEPISMNATKIKLIEYMWMRGIRDGREIEWHLVVKYFDGCTISFLRKVFNQLRTEAITVLRSRSMSDIMKWLHDVKIGRLRRSPTDHYLPRLRYVDKNVEIVHEDTTNVNLISTTSC